MSSTAARRVRLLTRALLLPAFLALLVSVAAATIARADTVPAADTTPDEVTAWLRDTAPSALAADAGAPSTVAADYKTATAQAEYGWSDGFLAGDNDPTPVSTTGRWLAAVSLNGEVVGGVVVQDNDGTVTMSSAVWDEKFGKALMGGAEVVWDPFVQGWFAIQDDQVWAVTDSASEYLAGTMTFTEIQPYVQQWNGTATETPTSADDDALPDTFPVAFTAVVMAGLLVVTGLVVFARRAEERHERD